MIMKKAVFLDVGLCRSAKKRRFGLTYNLNLQVRIINTIILVLTAVSMRNAVLWDVSSRRCASGRFRGI
jgi:hypothetical protein